MAEIRDTVYVDIHGTLNKVELIDCGFFRWEVAFAKQYKQTSNFDFYKLDSHGCEEHARTNFERYKVLEKEGLIAEFTAGNLTTRICRSWAGSFDAMVSDNRVKTEFRRTQENMTAEETIRYLANAANRR